MPKRRRAPGEGSIYQRKDGRWVAKVPISKPDGTTAFKYLYGDTQKEAREKRDRFLRELAAGKLPSDNRMLLRDYLDGWLTHSKTLTVRPSSLHVYTWAIGVINAHLGGTRLGDLKRPAIQRMIATIARDLAPRSVERVAVVLSMALSQAVEDELIPTNPATNLDKPRIPEGDHTTLTPEQIRTLLAHVRERSSSDAALYALLVTTGARISEALGLAWEDIDFEAGTVHLRRQLVWPRDRTGPVRKELKSAHGRRRLPLLPSTATELQSLRDSRPADGPDALVFRRPNGRPDRDTNVWHRLHTALRRSGLPPITTHALRHTNATLHLEAGTDIVTVSRFLGHADPTVTSRVYAHVTATLEQAAVARLGALLEPPTEPEGVKNGVKSPARRRRGVKT